MPFDLSKIGPSRKVVDIPDVGQLCFREPTLADALRAAQDPYWWGSCITLQDGSPFVLDNAQLAGIRSDIAERLMAEVTAVRPTERPSAAGSDSQARSNA